MSSASATGLTRSFPALTAGIFPPLARVQAQALLSMYRHEKFDLGDSFRITKEPASHRVRLRAFLTYDPNRFTGGSSELAYSAGHALKELLSGLSVLQARGNDSSPENRTGSHHFLVVADSAVSHGAGIRRYGRQDIEDLIGTDPWIVDPTSKRIVRYAESGYEILSLEEIATAKPHTRDLILQDGEAVPIATAADGATLYLGVDSKLPHGVFFGLRHLHGSAQQTLFLDDPKLAQKFARYREFAEFALKLSQAPMDEYRYYDPFDMPPDEPPGNGGTAASYSGPTGEA